MIRDVLNNPVPVRFRKISGSVLKTVAVVTMLIDHIGAGLLQPMLLAGSHFFMPDWSGGVSFYYVTRYIGRMAFPIYVFLLVEGFSHSRNLKGYALQLLLFALLSELPFDLALIAEGQYANTTDVAGILISEYRRIATHQNVFFTLLLGLLMIILMDRCFLLAKRASDDAARKRPEAAGKRSVFFYLLALLSSFVIFVVFYLLADLLHTDYSHHGIILAAVFYLMRKALLLSLSAGYLYFAEFVYLEVYSLPGFVLPLFYNGKRGFIRGGLKIAFYLFYPVHLVILYLVRCALL